MASNRKIVFAQVARLNKDGKRETILQAYEVTNGKREPISSPVKDQILEQDKRAATYKEFKARKK